MKIGIIAIGNELLSGFTIDRNSAWIGQRLLEIGLKVHVKKTIADDADMITKSLDEFSQDCDHIIITGGLGPTLDDITVKTLYEYFGDSPVFDEEYWEELEKRFKIQIIKISTMNFKGKSKNTTIRSGGHVLRTSGKRKKWKKAIVSVKEGQKIDLVEGDFNS